MKPILSQKSESVAETQLHVKPSNTSPGKLVWDTGCKTRHSLGYGGNRAQKRLRNLTFLPNTSFYKPSHRKGIMGFQLYFKNLLSWRWNLILAWPG